MSAPDFTRFTVTVDYLTDCVRVRVDADNPSYAEVFAPDVDTALRMAVPYMAAVASPMPFERLVRELGTGE